ncbi:MAG TPA: M36 family metallopeptidase [Gaiellaceae bacterium]|nr:M36 family metallopeptidase [Gaiellaceae bacterium]
MRFTRHRLILTTLIAAGTTLLVLTGAFAAQGKKIGKQGEDITRNKKAFFDSRQSPAAKIKLHSRAAALDDNPSAATASLKHSLGVEGLVTLDPLTGTVRDAGRTDGFLTGPSGASASSIALDYVTKSASAFGLTAQGIQALSLSRDYVSIDGTHHLSYVQKINGVPVFGNGLKVNVAKDGRVINVVGSPLADTSTQTSSSSIAPGQAITNARADAGLESGALTSDSATPVYFRTVDGTRIAYQTTIGTGSQSYQSVVDGQSGQVLYRRSLVDYANGLVLDNYPNAPAGGTVHTVDLTQNGWLSPTAQTLSGPNVHEYSDINDNNAPDGGEETKPGSYPITTFTPAACVPGFPCTWDPEAQNSWKKNEDQSAVQLFYFVNTWHDHLLAAPIGFTPAAGNFQDDDPVLAENLDGASTGTKSDSRLPDGAHIDNANFATPPDGQSGRMQMFLWHQPHTVFPDEDPFIAAMGSDEADIVYHENTHGLSNRLVVDAQGNSTLGGGQAGAMGEAWSDWYAFDYLVDQNLQPDTSADGELRVGNYVGWGNDLIRTQPLDCPVGSTSDSCPGGGTGHGGGYTYGDYGHIIGQVEVHADGEIWGETLWDLRNAVGSETAEALITRAMELSPSNPSMLDERNSILQADEVDFSGSNHDTIWSVFAHRGMGFFAGSLSGDDTKPVEDFSPPPAPGTPTGTLAGTVTDQDTGDPIQDVVVAFGGHASGFPGDLAGVTENDGTYEVQNVPFGSYPDVSASGAGYDTVVVPGKLTIGSPTTTQDFQLRRDWAALGGGGSITDFSGPDFSAFGCGPSGAIDQSQGNGWGSVTNSAGVDDGTTSPEHIVVKLPVAVDISEIQINPSNTCGDPGSSSVRGFTVETSTNGTDFTQVSTGVFYSGNRAKLNTISLSGPLAGINYVRFTFLNPQVPNATHGSCDDAASCGDDPNDSSGVAAHCGPGKDNGFGGCTFTDMSEIEVFGKAS